MAIGAVLLSLPVALFSTFWVSAFHGFDATEAFAVYTSSGFLTLVTILAAVALATWQDE